MEPLKGPMQGMQSPDTVSTKRQRIAELARNARDMSFTSLSHHMNLEWMREAYRLTRKDGAVGIDGVDAETYEANLDANLQELLNKAKSGTYFAPPVRRVFIPKGSGKGERPIGIPTFEDKVLQRAVVMLLEPLYEQDFLDCSYGFRPGRSAHQAVEQVRWHLWRTGGRWVVELDIKSYFDTIDRGLLREILSHRVRDGVIVKLIGKWLNAGVMDNGRLSRPDAGTPQGGVISPMLANIFLHEVLDVWFKEEVVPRLHGDGFMVRYADDAVLGFTTKEDADRVLKALHGRFGKFGLTLHPDKTRIVEFHPPEKGRKKDDGDDDDEGPRSSTFDFLGFTFIRAPSRQGKLVVKLKTAKDRLARAAKKVGQWCRRHRHDPIKQQHAVLSAKLRGHYNYFGVPCNFERINAYFRLVKKTWLKWLMRRSDKARTKRWDWFTRLLERMPLPKPCLPVGAR
jgi:RNA-directed DNA polymerase